MKNLRYLLFQIRDVDDPMREQEVATFIEALDCSPEQLKTFDLLAGVPDKALLDEFDVILIGGSGNYSAAGESAWLDRTLEGLRQLHALRKPTFASCWGFQAFARAAGGRCIHDPKHAELGTIELQLTEAGRSDPIFGELTSPFYGQAGHEDHVVELPPNAILLASSERVTNQAFKFADAPIYCTQFHPELDCKALVGRLVAYPQYVERIAGMKVDEFVDQCRDTPATRNLLKKFSAIAAST